MSGSFDYSDPQVVICGDSCLNIVLQIAGTLRRGANQDVTRMVRRPGGNALVTAMALSAWGIRSRYYGIMGRDSQRDELGEWMNSVGLDAGSVITRDISTRVSYVIMDDAERTILDLRTAPPHEAELQDSDWPMMHGIEPALLQAAVIMADKYCSGIHHRIRSVVESRRNRGERPVLAYRTGSRPSPSLQVEAGILPAADIVFTKSTYLEKIFPGAGLIEACRSFSRRFLVPVVAATAGKDGAAYFDSRDNSAGIVPALTVGKPGTTLGGGDFFRAGFILAYLEGKTVADSVWTGNTAAAVHVSRPEEENPETVFFSREVLEQALATRRV